MSRNTPITPTSNSVPAPSYISVNTSTGFNQGDLVFQNNGSFQQLTSQATSATFGNNVSQPILSGPLGGLGGSIGFPMSSSSTTTSGGSIIRNAALLTNGNIVMVGSNASGQAYFTIYDTSFNTVVSRVTLPSTFVCSNAVGVVALTGGGFVVFFADNANTHFAYAIYTNSGSVTLALTSATNFTCNSYWNCVALSNGGFVAVGPSSGTTNISYHIFNSSGTRVFGGTFAVASVTSGENPAVAAGASGSFAVFYRATGSTQYQWYLISSTNTTLASNQIAASSAYNNLISATTLADGINVVFLYAADNSGNFAFRSLNTSTYAIGAATSLTPFSTSNTGLFSSLAVRPLSSGGFIAFWLTTHSGSGGSLPYPGYFYSVFNSSGTPLGSSTQSAPSPIYRSFLQLTNVSVIANLGLSTLESGGNLYVFFNPMGGGSPSGAQAYTNYVQIDTTNYNPVASLGYTAALGSTTAGTGAVALSGCTPTKATYFPSANSATQFNSTSTTATTPTRVAALVSTNFDVCTLTNGNFVVAYRNESNFAVSVSVYSPTGTLLTTIPVGTGIASSQHYSVRITPLAGGKFVVLYTTSTSAISVNIFSSSYTVTSSFSITGLSFSLGSFYGYQGPSIGSLNSDRFVITATISGTSFPTYWVYNNAGTQLATGTIASSVFYPTAVQGHPSGGFTVAYTTSSTLTQFQYFGETATNTFTAQGATQQTGGTSYSMGKMYVNQFNTVYYCAPQYNATSIAYALIYSSNNNGSWYSTGSLFSSSSVSPIISIPTAYGQNAYVDFNVVGSTTAGVFSQGSKVTTTTVSSIGVANYTMTCAGTPLYGNTIVIVYPNSADNNFLTFSILTLPFSSGLVLNTTSSVSNAVSFASPNYPFVGVAANTVAAGGSGFVQTTGTTQLNSNYSASTPYQSFDFQTPSGLGVRGTISGRNITLFGNTQ